MTTKSLEQIAQETAEKLDPSQRENQAETERRKRIILAACEKAYDVGHNEGLSEAFELWRRQEVTATQPQRSEPRICDQCSRKLEDGALYEDHSKQTTTTEGEHEWTPEKVQGLMGIPSGTSGTVNWTEALRRIADAIAAERKEKEAWKRRAEGMKLGNENYARELAAEREKHETELNELTCFLEQNCYSDPDFIPDSRALRAAVKLRGQLAAERELVNSLRAEIKKGYRHES